MMALRVGEKFVIKKKSDFNQIVHEVSQYAFLCLITLGCVFCVFKYYNVNWSIMFCNQSDALGLANVARNYSSGIDRDQLLCAPFFDSENMSINTYLVHRFFLWLITRFTANWAQAANLFYVLGYALVSCSMYFALKKMKILPVIAGMLSIVYTFLPYHYLRGEVHIYLGMYYLVPPLCLLILRILEGKVYLKKQTDKAAYFNTFMILFWLWICGTSDIYYSVFVCILMIFAGVISSIEAKRIQHLVDSIIFCVTIFASIISINIPFVVQILRGQEMDAGLSSRTLTDLEIYGLRLSQLLLPIKNHRISLLAELRTFYDSFINDTESSMATLGLLMSFGFLYSIVCSFIEKGKSNEIKRLGQLNIFCVLLAGIGGFNVFVGLISATIRCYNRISVFVAAFSIMALAILLQKVYNKLVDVKKIRVVFDIVLVLMGLFAIWDQTPRFDAEARKKEVKLDQNTRIFVQEIEETVPKGSMIFMMPIITQNESSAMNGMRSYEQQWPAVYSDTLRWSATNNLGIRDKNRQWKSALSCMSIEEMLENVSVAGFEGIWIDKNGYSTEEEFLYVIEKIDKILGAPILVSDSGEQFYYSMNMYTGRLKEQYTAEEWENKKQMSLTMGDAKGNYYNYTQLSYTGNKQVDENLLYVEKGEVQYGPYCMLPAGEYLLEVYGKNLECGNLSITCEYGKERIPFDIVSDSEEQIVVTFAIDSDKDNVEFVLSNESTENLGLKYYYLESVD